MPNQIRFHTAYAFNELKFPICFQQIEEQINNHKFKLEFLESEFLNVARRLGDIDYFAWRIDSANVPGTNDTACQEISTLITAYFGACKALFDAVALHLNSTHGLGLPVKQQDVRFKSFWTHLKHASIESHNRYHPFKSLCHEVVIWRDASLHRAAPLVLLHLSEKYMINWKPEKGKIKIIARPDWRESNYAVNSKWMDPLDKHNDWHPQFIELVTLVCDDWIQNHQ